MPTKSLIVIQYLAGIGMSTTISTNQANQPWIIKLGGSVISDKTQPFTANHDAIQRLAKEIAGCSVPFILIHGGGSFGHPLAQEYDLINGWKNHKQLLGIGKTHQAMITLNQHLMQAFHQNSIPAMSFSPSSLFITRDTRILQGNLSPLDAALKLGINPILFGDIVFDQTQGFAILSGDQLLGYLGRYYQSERILLGTDTDGVYTGDPKINSEARQIPIINKSNMEEVFRGVGDATTIDVTGGMYGKLKELVEIAQSGNREIIIFNAKKKGNLAALLKGQPITCTRIFGGTH